MPFVTRFGDDPALPAVAFMNAPLPEYAPPARPVPCNGMAVAGAARSVQPARSRDRAASRREMAGLRQAAVRSAQPPFDPAHARKIPPCLAGPSTGVVRMQGESRAGKGKQDIEAAERLGPPRAFEQRRIARGLRPRASASSCDRRDRDRSNRRPGAHREQDQSLRKIRLPLVPPKPKELDSATSIGICRAVFGT